MRAFGFSADSRSTKSRPFPSGSLMSITAKSGALFSMSTIAGVIDSCGLTMKPWPSSARAMRLVKIESSSSSNSVPSDCSFEVKSSFIKSNGLFPEAQNKAANCDNMTLLYGAKGRRQFISSQLRQYGAAKELGLWIFATLDGELPILGTIPRILLRYQRPVQSPILSAAINASWGMSTFPNWRIFFLPAFCFSSSLRLRVTSPP